MLPSSTPSGTPTTAAIRKASSVRSTVTAKSVSSAPPASPVTSACKVSQGVGSRIALISPARTTRSQTMNSATGPTKGSSLPQENFAAGAAPGSVEPLHGFAAATVVVSVMAQALNSSGSTATFFSKMPLSENRS